MHASKAARGADEHSGRRKTLLPRLASSKDWRQWAFKTETILKQKELWYVIENATPARAVVALSANETARLRGQRAAQLAYETELKNQDSVNVVYYKRSVQSRQCVTGVLLERLDPCYML